MVRKQVTPLREQCVQLISDKIWNFSKEHYETCAICSFYQAEHCPFVQNVKETVTQLPSVVILNMYDVVYRKFQEHCTAMCEMKTKANLLCLLITLLGSDLSQIEIKKVCLLKHDVPLFLKFGKNIKSLCFYEYKYEYPDVLNLNISLWRVILRNTSNIVVLNVFDVKITDEYLQVIGQECNQLKALECVSMDCVLQNYKVRFNLTEVDSIISAFVMKEALMKLFFCDLSATEIAIRNKCCETLEIIDLEVSCNFSNIVYAEVVTAVLKHVPNLKSLGERFRFDEYIESQPGVEIRQTNMEDIAVLKLTHNLITALKNFSPKLKKLNVMKNSEIGCIQQLASFQYVDKLTLKGNMFYEIPTRHWANLRKLSANWDFPVDIDVDVLIQQLPLLEFFAVYTNSITWSGEKYFEFLKIVSLYISDSDISWFASFANTVKSLGVACDLEDCDYLHPSKCQIFLNVPFPCLKSLNIEFSELEDQLLIRVLKQLPKLEYCVMADVCGYDSQSNPRLDQAMKENNLICELRHPYSNEMKDLED